MGNIIVGVIFIIGGLTGQMALRGTNSSLGLAVVGVCIVGYGIYQVTERSGSTRKKIAPRRSAPGTASRPRLNPTNSPASEARRTQTGILKKKNDPRN